MFFLFPGCALIKSRLAICDCKFRIANVESVEYNSLRDPDRLEINLNIDCKNPDKAIEAVLDKLIFNFYVNNRETTASSVVKKVKIPPEATVQFPVSIQLSLSKIERAVFDVITSKKASYELKGTAFFSTPIGEKSIPVTISKGSWSGD